MWHAWRTPGGSALHRSVPITQPLPWKDETAGERTLGLYRDATCSHAGSVCGRHKFVNWSFWAVLYRAQKEEDPTHQRLSYFAQEQRRQTGLGRRVKGQRRVQSGEYVEHMVQRLGFRVEGVPVLPKTVGVWFWGP